jgi:hypothetical protein
LQVSNKGTSTTAAAAAAGADDSSRRLPPVAVAELFELQAKAAGRKPDVAHLIRRWVAALNVTGYGLTTDLSRSHVADSGEFHCLHHLHNGLAGSVLQMIPAASWVCMMGNRSENSPAALHWQLCRGCLRATVLLCIVRVTPDPAIW